MIHSVPFRLAMAGLSAALVLTGLVIVQSGDQAPVPSTAPPTPRPQARAVPSASDRTDASRNLPASIRERSRGASNGAKSPDPGEGEPPPLHPAVRGFTPEPSTTGAFVAEQLPLLTLLGEDAVSCFSDGGIAQRTIRRFRARTGGILTVQAPMDHAGWVIYLLDHDGEVIVASGPLGAGPSGIRVIEPLKPRQEVEIVACNESSAQIQLRVTYRFEPTKGPFNAPRHPEGLSSLAPGHTARLTEEVPVTFVFLGYEPQQIDVAAFMYAMPATYRPLLRIPDFYQLRKFLGIEYRYRLRTMFTERGYEDRFFSMLLKNGNDGRVTEYQQAYNESITNRLEVENNLEIDAPSVERWLAENPPPGVDPQRNTVFFINFFPRDDFRFHVYTKYGELDTDFGTDHGRDDAEKLIAWGGTAQSDPETGRGPERRIWFHDLSAGPEGNTGNWDVDLGGETMMPPVWEYGDEGFKGSEELTYDLAKVARYVALNLLFTPSPLYSPALTPPDIPDRVHLRLLSYEEPGVEWASESYLDPGVVAGPMRLLLPLSDVSAAAADVPFTPQMALCYSTWITTEGPSCYPDRPYTSAANLFVHHALTYDSPRSGAAPYELLMFNYFSNFEPVYFAFADDNYKDGTQSFVHSFIPAHLYDGVFGLTNIAIHEAGHHFGLSHTHDGYDYEEDFDYGPTESYIWVGDESNSAMSYLDINNEFSQFDQDNINRWLTAAYITAANTISGDIFDSGPVTTGNQHINRADKLVGRATALFSRHEYLAALKAAKSAYEQIRAAADAAGVKVIGSRSGRTVDEPGQGLHEGGGPDYMYVDALEEFGPLRGINRTP